MAITGDTTGLMSLKYDGKYKLPERDSYKVAGQAFETVSVNSGLSRQFVQFMNSPFRVSLNYRAMDASEAAYLFNFFNTNRGRPFIVQLMISGTSLEEFVVKRVDNQQFGITGVNGNFSVSLEVAPSVNHCFIEWTLWAFPCQSGSKWAKVFCNTKSALESWL